MASIKNWVSAFRLRTLPLALSSILMGNILAHWQGKFDGDIMVLAMVTTILLQILSNLANDYGDTIHGADSTEREGPKRAVQTGAISSTQMKNVMYVFAGLSLISGLSLLYLAFREQLILILVFLGIGLAAIYAAITYTAGKRPYGYMGLGDISVFLFFGIVGVMGSFFLQAQTWDWAIALPAISCGLLATGVLNVNNIRDIVSDELAGKNSIPVRIGRDNAVIYHFTLLATAMITGLVFAILNFDEWTGFLFLLAFPLFIKNAIAVKTKVNPMDLDPYLKQLAISTLFYVVLFGVGVLISG